MREVEIIKIGAILNSKDPIMMISLDKHDDIWNYYSKIVRDTCKDEFAFQKTARSIINTSDGKFPFNRIVVVNEPKVGGSLYISGWHSSKINRIINNNIILTNNSVYALHSIVEFRDKKLKDLGI